MDTKTLRCGLLGRKLGHSYSPAIHERLADYSYRLFEVEPEDLGAFLQEGAFDGLNVTIPYKKDVIPYCAELSDTARAIGAVNTLVRRADGTLWGDNTDAYGFSMLVQSSGADVAGKKALVFGSGGASATAQYVLRQLGAREVVVISRHGEDNYENLDRHADAQIAVNTTPVGMYPNTGVSPVDLHRLPRLEAALDVVYNPARTEFLLQAEARGLRRANGLLMLAAQAKKSCEDFTSEPVDDAKIFSITKALEAQMHNVILIGMPGSGKTTIGTLVAKRLGRTFVDADSALEREAGMPIPEIFRLEGEAWAPAFPVPELSGARAITALRPEREQGEEAMGERETEGMCCVHRGPRRQGNRTRRRPMHDECLSRAEAGRERRAPAWHDPTIMLARRGDRRLVLG